ncbi:MAG: hypothetical protein ACRDRG_21565 [Pseudonocardiaceae bacterium]
MFAVDPTETLRAQQFTDEVAARTSSRRGALRPALAWCELGGALLPER